MPTQQAAGRHGAYPVSGFIALSAMVFQYPWLAVVIAMAVSDPDAFGPRVTSASESIYIGVAAIPTVLGIAFASHSIWVAGAGKKNACGVIALLLVAIEMLCISYAAIG